MERVVIIIVSVILCGCESAASSWFPPSMTAGVAYDIKAYAMTRDRARAAVLAYCEMWLEQEKDKPRLPYRATFLRAMDGDARALYTIFSDRNYHTGDNEAWGDARWPILLAVGDDKFAAFLRQLPRQKRKQYSEAVATPYVPESQLRAYAAMHLPRVWAIYQREHK